MMEKTLQTESLSLTKALPFYLTIQGTTLLFTFLDVPIHVEAYQINHMFALNGWTGTWFILVLFGLANGVFLLIRKPWKLIIQDRARINIAMGYLIGGLIGLLTLGLRYLLMIPSQYFIMVGVFAFVLISAYLLWKKRLQTTEELFP